MVANLLPIALNGAPLSSVIYFSTTAPSALCDSLFNNISSLPSSVHHSCIGLPHSHSSHPQSSPSISSCTNIFILAQQQVLECLFKCGITQCITSWVDGRVDITQPVAYSPHSVRDTGLAEG